MSESQAQCAATSSHLNAEFLIAIANGARVEDFNIPENTSDVNRVLIDILKGKYEVKVTRKPLKRMVNGFWVNAPETVLPLKEKYYVSRPDLPKKFIETKNCNEFTDKHYLSMGLVFLTPEDAIANANAMCLMDPGPVP
ncbi:MAG: hypothetical protein LW632_00855 [Burkholderiaceae bacterium]|jgi:hypothetical protein|nr:hypothetical protein [Burkholderiales bacterium]MCE2676671.1 hypothetical protein [Burkholderiaceae bacterium]